MEDPWQHRQGWKKRVTWEDALIAVYGEEWRQQASNWEQWAKGEDDYIYQFLELSDLGGAKLRRDRNKAKAALADRHVKERRQRVVDEPVTQWRKPGDESFLLDVKGDSLLVTAWSNGHAR
eukprot:6332242-Karenia_brevis.AAC.1